MTIDVHAHAFPEELAPKAIGGINSGIPEHAHAVLDGTVDGLLRSMDRAGIQRSVLCNIATKPTQVEPIIRWSLSVASERITPLGSVHPDGEDPAADVRRVADAGLVGIKLHAMYQDFRPDEPRMWPVYAAMVEHGLVLTFHAGRDVAYPDDAHRAAPGRILRVHRAFPELPIVAAHMGGWRMWGQVVKTLAGTTVYLETSYTFDNAEPDVLARILERHSTERILFGTDSPWRDQAETLELVRRAFPDDEARRQVLHGNAERLYKSAGCGVRGAE